MRSLGRPLHLLLFHEACANDLIVGRLHKHRTDGATVTIAFADVGEERLIVTNVSVAPHDGAMKFGSSG